MSDLATQIIEKAHAAGVRTVITFQSFGTTKNAAFFSNPAAQATFVNQAVALMATRGADGANLDVEDIAGTYFPAYGALTGVLRSAAKGVNPIATVRVAVGVTTRALRAGCLSRGRPVPQPVTDGAQVSRLDGARHR